ncbi:MAG: IS66 family insertion sequence element accessory protein TnpB [Vicinamibacterales bacterium]
MNISFVDRYRYFIYRGGCDMRKGYDGLCGLVLNEFKMSPLSGDVFVFLSKPRNKIKILHWQGDGFIIYSKRLEKGTFELPKLNSANASIEISSDQLQFILSGIILSSIKKRIRYQHANVNNFIGESGISRSI